MLTSARAAISRVEAPSKPLAREDLLAPRRGCAPWSTGATREPCRARLALEHSRRQPPPPHANQGTDQTRRGRRGPALRRGTARGVSLAAAASTARRRAISASSARRAPPATRPRASSARRRAPPRREARASSTWLRSTMCLAAPISWTSLVSCASSASRSRSAARTSARERAGMRDLGAAQARRRPR